MGESELNLVLGILSFLGIFNICMSVVVFKHYRKMYDKYLDAIKELSSCKAKIEAWSRMRVGLREDWEQKK